jgi:hypothetical protein
MTGYCLIFEESVLRKYYIEPIQLLGYEALLSFVVYLVIITIMTFIPCSFGDSCVYTTDGSYLERPEVYFR